ncbi:MAG: hypothetical protein R3E96_01385 [Planctomycetota bacterium]
MGILKSMTAMKAMILCCLIAGGVLGWMGWKKHERVVSLQSFLGLDKQDQLLAGRESRAQKLATDLQLMGLEYSDLVGELDNDIMRGESSPQSEIRKIATLPKIALGGLDINPSSKQGRGYTDSKYLIKPAAPGGASKNKTYFPRTKIANFMYRLEERYKRVKVTSFRIEPPKTLKPEEIPTDQWSFQCEITVREKEQKGE